jgi:hypothetical protein
VISRDASGRSLDEVETAMQAAMLVSDVSALDLLISNDLVFIGPDGSQISKAADLAAHRTGTTRFERIDEIEREIVLSEAGGLTVLVADVTIIDHGKRTETRLRWERSWTVAEGLWQVTRGRVTPAR